MTETTFYGGAHPFALLEDRSETPFLSMASRRKAGRVRTLRRLDVVTDILDEALAEPLDLTPLSVEPQWPRTSAAVEQASDSGLLRQRALTAIAEIRSTLAISHAAAASLVRVARNTLASWRKGERDPYPATVRTLFEIHAVVAAASALLGDDDARAWFHGYSGDETRLSALAEDGGAQRLAAELRFRLFPGSGTHTLPPPGDDADDGLVVEAQEQSAYAPDAFAQPTARRRRLR